MRNFFTEANTEIQIWAEDQNGAERCVEVFVGYWEDAKERIEKLMDENPTFRSMWLAI